MARAQDEPTSAEQVITRYKEAIGAERFRSVQTFEERGEISGNVTNFWPGSRSPRQSQEQHRATYEFYFKAPNLRFSSTINENNQVLGLDGCDGKVSWYIDAYLKRVETKPKPGNEENCKQGYEQVPPFIDEPNAKLRLMKKKEVEGRMAWEVKVELPKTEGSETYYFDAATYLLLQSTRMGFVIRYSDYRDVGGIKLPFVTTFELNNSKRVTTVREMKINSPIEDARFAEPQVKGGRVETGTVGAHAAANPGQSAAAQVSGTERREPFADNSSLRAGSGAPSSLNSGTDFGVTSQVSDKGRREPGAPSAPSVSEVNFPNFTACSMGDLQQAVPELKGLKPAGDQQKLAALLDKVGEKTVDMARHTPDLISLETVTESQRGSAETRRDYDYLILNRVAESTVTLDEFRVDRQTGARFESDEEVKKPSLADVERASQDLAASSAGRAPISQGFANSWVHFYPRNRRQANFRYLGEQKTDGQRTLVLAFAEKPESVPTPSLFRSKDKTVPMFLQGVAWVSATDFRILRLRTDLLSPLPEVSLHRLTTETQFMAVRIAGVDSELWLPRDVMVTAEVQGMMVREGHMYSDYRLFRAKSKVVLN